MNEKEQKSASKKFADYCKDKGYEKGEYLLSLKNECITTKTFN